MGRHEEETRRRREEETRRPHEEENYLTSKHEEEPQHVRDSYDVDEPQWQRGV